mgnify:CR=1 FL=1
MLTIDSEFKSLIPALTAEEYAQLEENILREGIRDSLVTWNGILLDGHNRYEIAQRHGLDFDVKEMEFESRADAERWVILNQFGRRNLSAYDRSLLALRLKPMIAAKARNRMLAGKENPVEKFPQGKTREHLAKIAGVSDRTIDKVEKIEQDATPEIKAAVKSGEMSINQAYQATRREEKAAKQEDHRRENAEKVASLATPLDAQGLFQTIVIDPPWDWGDEEDVSQFGRARPEYQTMPISEIEQMPIERIADTNCHLYLWVTNRSLPKAFRLIEAWGFRYVTCITWVKPSFGMGNYFRGSTEQVLFAVKGSQPLKRHDVGTHFMAARGNGHSAKPDEFYSIVESCSHGPYIDIFGRKAREGWTVWGENG